MTKPRPVRTLGATLATVTALIVSLFAGQDLWHYWQAITAGYTEWAVSSQGWWMLTCGLVEVVAGVALAMLAVRFLGSRPLRLTHAPSDAPSALTSATAP